eukprot:gene12224-12362_t
MKGTSGRCTSSKTLLLKQDGPPATAPGSDSHASHLLGRSQTGSGSHASHLSSTGRLLHASSGPGTQPSGDAEGPGPQSLPSSGEGEGLAEAPSDVGGVMAECYKIIPAVASGDDAAVVESITMIKYRAMRQQVCVHRVGGFRLKGVDSTVSVVQVLPAGLEERLPHLVASSSSNKGKARCVAPACGLLARGLCMLPDLTQLVQCIPSPMDYTQLLPQQEVVQASHFPSQAFSRAHSSSLPAVVPAVASDVLQVAAGVAAAGNAASAPSPAFAAGSGLYQQSVLNNSMGVADHSSVTVEMAVHSTKEPGSPAKQPPLLDSCGTGASSSPTLDASGVTVNDDVQGGAAQSAPAAKAASGFALGPAGHPSLGKGNPQWSQPGQGSGDWLLKAGESLVAESMESSGVNDSSDTGTLTAG